MRRMYTECSLLPFIGMFKGGCKALPYMPCVQVTRLFFSPSASFRLYCA